MRKTRFQSLLRSTEQALVLNAVTPENFDTLNIEIKNLEESGQDAQIKQLTKLRNEVQHELDSKEFQPKKKLSYEALLFSIEHVIARGACTRGHLYALNEHIEHSEKIGRKDHVYNLARLRREVEHELDTKEGGL